MNARFTAQQNPYVRCRNKVPRGITLMELMMVIAIVGVLSGMVFMSISSTQNKSKANEETTVIRLMLKKARNMALGNLTCTRIMADQTNNVLRYIEFDYDPISRSCPSPGVTAVTTCAAMPAAAINACAPLSVALWTYCCVSCGV